MAAAMKRAAARASTAKTKKLSTNATPTRRSTRGGSDAAKKEETPTIKDEEVKIKAEPETPRSNVRTSRKREASPSSTSPSRTTNKKVKTEKKKDTTSSKKATASPSKPKTSPTTAAADLQSSKLKKYSQYSTTSPYPNYPHPTPSECYKALSILESLHGPRQRPSELKASAVTAGCGDSPSVLDALVRTILSQNTSNRNSTAAKLSLDDAYGASDNWPAIVAGGSQKLISTIRCGGLAVVKSRVILQILSQVHDKYGAYSLDHLHDADTETAFTTLLSFQGVGPKTASCVVLFCLGRDSFAVDTHVFRISKLLGWVPRAETDREKAQAHLEVAVPDECKYALHILMVGHGKVCGECKAKRESGARCKLRDAFRGKKGGGVEDEEGEQEAREEEDGE